MSDRYGFPGSSRIVSGEYDEKKRTVRLTFPDGTRWVYLRVPAAVWEKFKKAESAGAYLRQVIEGYPNHEG